MTNHELHQQFLDRFPASSLASMTIEQYTQAGSKDTFCYWLEAKTQQLGSIWGGSAFKFGIYSRQNLEAKQDSEGVMYDDKYGWYRKFGGNQIMVPMDTTEITIRIPASWQVKLASLVESADYPSLNTMMLELLYLEFPMLREDWMGERVEDWWELI